MNDATCARCRYSTAGDKSDPSGNLLCRRYPPAASPLLALHQIEQQRIQIQGGIAAPGGVMLAPQHVGSIAVWPIVKPTESCGEHAPKVVA
jgi:hypothetical protein